MTVDDGGLALILGRLGSNDALVRGATKAAVARTARYVRTRARRALGETLNIKYSATARFVRVSHGRFGDGFAVVSVSGSRFKLPEFIGTRQFKRAGTRYRIRRDGPRSTIRSAFIADDPAGYSHAWKRLTKKRYPIIPLFGPSPPQVLEDDPAAQRALVIDGSAELTKQMERQVDRFVARIRTEPRRGAGGGGRG